MVTPNEFDALWNDALQKYGSETGSDLLQSDYAQLFDDCDSVDTVVDALEQEMEAFKKFRSDDSKWATLRNKLKPVVHFVLLFNDATAEAAASHAPGGKSILVAFGVLLTATQGVSERYDALVELFEKLGSFLGRLGIRLDVPSSLGPISKTIVVNILVHLLHVFALSTQLIKKKRITHYVQVLFGNQDMKDALSRLDKLTTLETQTIVAETRTVVAETQTVVAETQITAAEILVGVKALESSGQFDRVAISSLESKVVKLLDMQVVRDIKSWLSAPDPSTSHSNVLKTRHRGTGSWFLEGKTFADWKTSNNSVFWIYGSPGSGKSVLCSSIIDMLAPTSSLAYFYCDFRDTQTQNARGLLSSLVSQLSVVSSESLDILRRVHRDNSGVPNGALLFASLSEMSDVSGDVFIIIDALDECTGSAERAEILEYLERLVKLDRPQLHVLVASRPEADIQSCMMRMKTHQLDLQAVEEQAEDLRLYVSYQLEKMKWDNILVLAAFDKLTAKANGSFRWVACQIDSLRTCLLKNVRKILETLPKTLEETYRRILERIPKECRSDAYRIFHMIAFARRGLSAEELGEVFAVDFDTDPLCPQLRVEYRESEPATQLLRICSSLIRILPSSQKAAVEFSHFTVDEYLRSAEHMIGTLNIYRLDAELAHTTLAQMCLSCILSDEYTTNPPPSGGPFGGYATEYWTSHARYGHVSTSTAQPLLQIFKSGCLHFDVWSRIYRGLPVTKSPRNSSEYQAACLPLLWAAYNGFDRSVEEIINAGGVDLDEIISVQPFQHMPLRIPQPGLRDSDRGFTALHLSSRGGHIGVVNLLLKHGADIEACTHDGRTALYMASALGQTDVVRLLLEHGANIDAAARHGKTALYAAAENNRRDLMILLLEHGANINARTKADDTILNLASAYGETETVSLLLQHGADMEAVGFGDETALFVASTQGKTSTVRLLLERGANIEACNIKGRTALHMAMVLSHLDVVHALIQSGAHVNTRSYDGSTPLHMASAGGEYDIAKFLLEHNADIEARDGNGLTALYAACWHGHSDIVRLLLEHGASTEVCNGDGRTELNGAAWFGRTAVVELLLKHGVNVDARDEWGDTALHVACKDIYGYGGYPDIVRMLLEHGADKEARNFAGRTPMDIVSGGKQSGIVDLLLQH